MKFGWLFLFFSLALCAEVRVGVLPFEVRNETGVENAPVVIASLVANQLGQFPDLKMEERIHLNELLQKKAMEQSGYFSMSQVQEIGTLQSVDALVIGTVMKLGETLYLSARMIEVSSSNVLGMGTIKVEDLHDLKKATEDLAWALAGRTPNQLQAERVKRSYQHSHLLLRAGTGWQYSLFDQWHELPSGNFEHHSSKDHQVPGMVWEVQYQNSWSDLSLGGVVPYSLNGVWVAGTLFPWEQIGFTARSLYFEVDQMKEGEARSGGRFLSALLGMKFRLHERLSFSIEKGKTLDVDSDLRYQSSSFKTPSIAIEERFSFLHGPTLASLDFQYSPQINVGFLYYHNLERSLSVKDGLYQTEDRKLSRDVTGFYRLMALMVGYRFGI